MKHIKILLTLTAIAFALAFSSCAPSGKKEDQSPAARGTTAYDVVYREAYEWTKVNPSKRKVAKIGDTGSMLRLMDSSCIALIEGVAPDADLKIGNIYGYRTTERYIVHRLVEIKSDGTLIFQGDSNDAADTPAVNRSQVEYILVGVLYTTGNPTATK